MVYLRIVTVSLIACLALSGCISSGVNLHNNNGDHTDPTRVETLSTTTWASGRGGATFDVPSGYDYVVTTYQQGGQTYGTASYVDGNGNEVDGGVAATHAGGFQLVRTAPPTAGSTTFQAPYGMGGGTFTAVAYDNVDATLLLALAWGGSRADTFGVDTTFGFFAPSGPDTLNVIVQSGGNQGGTISLEAPDGTVTELRGPASGGSQTLKEIPNQAGIWKTHIAGAHNGGNQITVSAVPDEVDLSDWF